jgi:hypothetical protein
MSGKPIPNGLAALVCCLFAALGMALALGCQAKNPPTTAVYPTPSTIVNRSLISDFESGVVNINPYLYEQNNPAGSFLYGPYTTKFISPGQRPPVTIVNNFQTLAQIDPAQSGIKGPGLGANGSNYSFHVAAAVTDLGDFEYPGIDLQTQFEDGNFYDASPWHGVKFMMKVGPGDTATHRIFSIPVYQTVAIPGGGGCGAGPKLCYDHFAADYSAGTGGQWKQFSYLFSDLHQLVAGAIPNPPTLSGLNLQQVLWLQWEEGRNNAPGASKEDLWVDDIEFF